MAGSGAEPVTAGPPPRRPLDVVGLLHARALGDPPGYPVGARRARPAAPARTLLCSQPYWPRLEKQQLLQHTGCVNTVQWSDDGGIVVSGSDDLSVCLWDASCGYRLMRQLRTGHRANVFCARLLRGNRAVLSCSRDGALRLTDVETGSRDCVFNGRSSMQKFVLLNQHTTLTAAEDGTVRRFDLRTDRSLRYTNAEDSIVADVRPNELTTIALQPTDPHVFAVAGGDADVRLYDIRRPAAGDLPCLAVLRPSNTMGRGHVTGVAFSDDGARLAATLSGDDVFVFDVGSFRYTSMQAAHVDPCGAVRGAPRRAPPVASPPRATFSPGAPAAAAASVAAGDSLSAATGDGAPASPSIRIGRRALSQGDSELGGIAFFGSSTGPMSSESDGLPPADGTITEVATRSAPAADVSDLNLDEDDEGVPTSPVGTDAYAQGQQAGAACSPRPAATTSARDDISLSTTCSGSLAPSCLPNRQEQVGYLTRLTGHRSIKTVKEVTFMGPRGRWVVSGSDCGGIFVWDSASGLVEHVFVKADRCIANGIAPHPSGIPLMASCGIDSEVKVWSASRPAWECPGSTLLARRHAAVIRRNMCLRRRPYSWQQMFLDDSDPESTSESEGSAY